MRRGLRLVGVLVLLVLPSVPALGEESADEHPARTAGLQALKAGNPDEAVGHLLHALTAHPDSAQLLLDLIRATEPKKDFNAIWRHRYVCATADEKGRFKPAKELLKTLFAEKDEVLVGLAKARAKAASDIARELARAKGPGRNLVAATWYELLERVVRDCPPLRKTYLRKARSAVRTTVPKTLEVIKAIEKAAPVAFRSKDPGHPLRLGRALIGLAAQFGKGDSAPSGVDGGRMRSLGERLQRSAREALAEVQMEPLTVEALEAMSSEEIEAFNDKHTNMSTPGRAITPQGLYEVVSPCGHGTLLAAAKHVEPIHETLAKWFGKDPFQKRRGQIRIFPEFSDLESEGTPYWWAKGFQSGSITTIQFSLGSVNEMMRILTHELTHRFDQVFHPAMPAWLSEGRAEWTEGAWTTLDELTLRERYLSFRHIRKFWSWYGDSHGLKQLLRQQMDDYRDNYTTGHVLWVFLTTWRDKNDKPVFQSQTKAFLASLVNAPADTVAHFEQFFCDGAEGRPEDLKAFAKLLQKFVDGFSERPRAKWVKRYVGEPSMGGGVEIFDGPVLSRTRERTEPFFGQDHIRNAAMVLGEIGQHKAGVALLIWALNRDELRASELELLESLLNAANAKQAGVAAYMERLRRAAWPADRESPVDRSVFLKGSLRSYIAALEEAAKARDDADLHECAVVFKEEHARLALPLGLSKLPTVPPGKDDEVLPEHRIPVEVDRRGWKRDKLHDYDRSAPDKGWMKTAEGHLVVGRNTAVTAGDAMTDFGDVFVRTKERFRTGYAFRTRIHILSPFVSGAVVFGYKRHDRSLQMSFDGGIQPRHGAERGADIIDTLRVRLEGGRPFERVTGEYATWDSVGLVKENNSFDLVVHVKGSRIECWIDGKRAGRISDPDGLPLDGHIGFAKDAGAYRVENPVILPLERVDPKSGQIPFDAEIHTPRIRMGHWVVGGRLFGATPSPHGTIVVWYPLGYFEGEEASLDEVAGILRRRFRPLRNLLKKEHHRADCLVVLPEAWKKALTARFKKEIGTVMGKRMRVRFHGEGTERSPPDNHRYWGYEPAWMFLDPQGIVRAYAYRRFPDDARVDGRRNLFHVWLELTRGW